MCVSEKIISYSAMHVLLLPCLYGSITSSTICYHDTSSAPSSSLTLRRLPTSTTTTTPFETDEARRLRRTLLMSQQRCTGSWTHKAIDDADAIYTTTTHACMENASED